MLEVGTKVKVIDGKEFHISNGSIGAIARIDQHDDSLLYHVLFEDNVLKWMRASEIQPLEPATSTYYIAWSGTNIPSKTEEDGKVILEAIRHTDSTATLHRVSDEIIS